MGLTLIKSPTIYNFSRNKNYVEVETDNYYESVNVGKKAVCYFNGLNLAILNDTLTITFGVTTIVYTFKAATNIGLKQLAYYVSGDVFDYIVQLVGDLRTDSALSTYINVTAYESAVFFEAINPGTTYNMSYSTTTAAGVGFYSTNGTNDLISQIRPNYRIGVDIQIDNGGTWESVIEVQQEPVNDRIRLDVARYIDDALAYDLPTFYTWIAFKCEKVIRKFRGIISEYYGDPQALQSAINTTSYFELKAGIDTISAKIRSSGQFVLYSANGAFLTRQSRNKKIGRNQIEYLYFYFPNTLATTAVLRIIVYRPGGSTTYDTYSTSAITANDVWAFPTNFPGALLSDMTVYKMEVFVVDSSTNLAISETFTYTVDENEYVDETLFYFANSDGGLDSLRCVGVNEMGSDFERVQVNRTLTLDDTNYDGNMMQTFVEKTNGGKTFSGWVKREDLTYIEELFLSKKVFTYGNIYGQNIEIPLIILNKTHVRHRTKTNLFGYIIEYQEAIRTEISQTNYYPVS